MRTLCLLMLLAVPASAADPARRTLAYAPAPADNPLKGLVPYAGVWKDRFPHSLEFNYLPLGPLVPGPGRYDWRPMEKLLDDIAGRGHQAVIRIYIEYPKKTDGIPAFLVANGLKVHKYTNTNTAPLPPAPVETPDYENAELRKTLREFITAFGKKYDGDPRLGYVTAGLLGTWGEWHTYPKTELWASKAVQAEVMDAYEAAFTKTPVLLRYPAGDADPHYAPNHTRRRLGYHDDSFAWATLDTGKKGDEWFYCSLLKRAGPGAVERWKTAPIGGEIRPEAWGKVFDAKPGNKQIQDFARCVAETHATWLMDSGMFEKKPSAERLKRATEQVRRMGYELHVPAVTIGRAAAGKLPLTVELENRGVAPFYPNWRPEFALLSGQGLAKTLPAVGRIDGLLPGDPVRTWAETFDLGGLTSGEYTLLLRVPNPLKNGHPVRFANTDQDRGRTGWLTLGTCIIP